MDQRRIKYEFSNFVYLGLDDGDITEEKNILKLGLEMTMRNLV